MQHEIMLCEHGDYAVRLLVDNGHQPWFALGDVVRLLGYTGISPKIRRSCPRARRVDQIEPREQSVAELIRTDPTTTDAYKRNALDQWLDTDLVMRSDSLMIPTKNLEALRRRGDGEEVISWLIDEVAPALEARGYYLNSGEALINLMVAVDSGMTGEEKEQYLTTATLAKKSGKTLERMLSLLIEAGMLTKDGEDLTALGSKFAKPDKSGFKWPEDMREILRSMS